MIPRIKNFTPLNDFCLLVSFEDGRTVVYDVGDDIATIPAFKELKTESCLFQNARIDTSRTCIYWSDTADLPSDIIYEYGKTI